MLSNLRALLKAHRVLLLVCVVIMVNQLGFGIIVPVTPIFAQSFGLNEAQIGLVISIYGLGRFLFSVPVGQAADRFGRKNVILAGTILTCIGSVFCGLAGSYLQLLIWRFVAGVGSTAVITGTTIAVADVATRENRGRMMSTYSGFFQFAVGVGPSVGGLIALWSGPRAPFFAFAGLTTLAGLITLSFLPETRPPVLTTSAIAAPPSSFASYRLLLFNVGFLTVSAVSLTAAFNRTGAIFSVVPLMGVSRIGLDTAQIGLALTIGNLCNLGIVGVIGILVDRFGRKAVIVPSCIFDTLAYVGFAYVTGYPGFVASAVLWGIGVAASGAASSAYAADQAPPGANGVTMGVYRMLSDVGYVVGPALLGVIAQFAGSQAALLTSAGMAIAAMIPFMLFAPETGGRRFREAAERASSP